MIQKQLAFALEHRPAHGAEDFLVAACNEEAVGWIDQVPNWQTPAVIISGPKGCGKTHVARVFIATTGAVELSADSLNDSDSRDTFSYAVFENADQISGQKDQEEALFHLYNRLSLSGGAMLLTAETPAARWQLTIKDLDSRLRAAPNPEISAPDDATLTAVLVKLFADRQIAIDEDVIRYIVPRMERTFAAAIMFVEDADQMALEGKRRITVPLARQVLELA